MSDTVPDTSLTHGRRQWTAADFFSTYRYWALFIALLLMVFPPSPWAWRSTGPTWPAGRIRAQRGRRPETRARINNY